MHPQSISNESSSRARVRARVYCRVGSGWSCLGVVRCAKRPVTITPPLAQPRIAQKSRKLWRIILTKHGYVPEI